MKYQFCIRFSDVDADSAASKAVLDCNEIFSQNGYADFTFTVANNRNRYRYYPLLLKNLMLLFFSIKRRATVAVQYPLLSINNLLRYFALPLRLKNASFFCIVHDLHSLRTGGSNPRLIRKDIVNLNCFDVIIVHNNNMLAWLKQHGLKTPAVVLEVFDYLSDDFEPRNTDVSGERVIVYAGNLVKSKFIYGLHAVKGCRFNLYGPGFDADLLSRSEEIKWQGRFSPEQIAKELRGNYGLIWDGESCESYDDILGNYLRYNSPHKFSLYITAGLPVIAPLDSAIGVFIKARGLGVLVSSLYDLQSLEVSSEAYSQMRKNVLGLRKEIMEGHFFKSALQKVESRRA